ncbi:hypothetical protein PZN02_002029 [Sinorhizobium garamanticum]|uniref:Uncharacterized protein n=1 Tax=Sinorhizobium garamanticum TaxID=680247 RepID=A0ABY8D9T5_9HYPH|nr:hypothetical protein [Sinorhizobium garamanticum]WEX85796.1 hypothetical protein PZN02_002029 [Sinorhizobium garamanticum]
MMSYSTPDGAEPWKRKLDETFSVTLIIMPMVGVIPVATTFGSTERGSRIIYKI